MIYRTDKGINCNTGSQIRRAGVPKLGKSEWTLKGVSLEIIYVVMEYDALADVLRDSRVRVPLPALISTSLAQA
jgi:hypothetical protein